MKKICIAVFALLYFAIFPFSQVFANEDIFDKQFDAIDSSEINEFIENINSKYREYLPEYNFKDLINTLRGNKIYDLKGLVQGIIKYFFYEITANYHLLGELIALSVICAVLKGFQSAFENDNIGKVTHSVIFLVLILIAIQSFNLALNVGKEAIDQMVSFVQALLPIIFTLLASIGGITSVAVFNPLIFVGITIASTWIKSILLPVIFFTAVLGLISNISDRFNVSALASLLKQICVFLLGLFLSVFLGVLVVHGAAASVMDGITIRTAKFASKNFIPIVGGIFSDTIDTIVGCSLLLKNAISVVGLLIVFLLTIFPVIKILSIVFIYRFTGAIIQPLGEESIVKCLNDMANSLTLIFITVSSVAVMFFVAITVILTAGNVTVMMR